MTGTAKTVNYTHASERKESDGSSDVFLELNFMFESDNQEKIVIDNNIPGLVPFYVIPLFHFLATVQSLREVWTSKICVARQVNICCVLSTSPL